jgi:hypothetical protein
MARAAPATAQSARRQQQKLQQQLQITAAPDTSMAQLLSVFESTRSNWLLMLSKHVLLYVIFLQVPTLTAWQSASTMTERCSQSLSTAACRQW